MINRILYICVAFFLFTTTAYAGSYKVMTWNLEDMDIFDGNGFERIPIHLKIEKAIASTIKKIDPDILFISESPSLVHLQYFVQTHLLDYQVAHVRQQKGNRKYADGMAMLVRSGLEIHSINLVTPPVPGSKRSEKARYMDWSARGIMVAQIEDFVVAGVHLKSPGGRDKKKVKKALIKQHGQAQGVEQYLSVMDMPVVLLGDFNDGPGFGDLEKEYGQPDTLSVFDKKFKWASGYEGTHEGGYNIDHIFVKSGNIEKRNLVTVPFSISDHRPVWSVVSID